MAKAQVADGRRVPVNISLDTGLLTRIDAEAERSGLTRSALVRRLIEAGLEEEAESRWLAEEAEAALAEERVPWEQAPNARLGNGIPGGPP